MRVHLLVNGRPRVVSIERRGQAWTVAVDGHQRVVDGARLDATTYLLLDHATGRSHQAGVATTAARDELAVHLREGVVSVQVSPAGRPARAAEADATASDTGRRSIAASMPGKVVRVLVAEGDAVTARQGVVIVEAMKMENELRTPKAGRVAAVHAREGMLVEAGRVLVVVE